MDRWMDRWYIGISTGVLYCLWYVLSCLYGGAYERTLVLNEKRSHEVVTVG